MVTIKKLLGLIRQYHVWDNQTGTGECFWMTKSRAQEIAACGYCVMEVR